MWLKLAVPLVLGVVAAGINWQIMQSHLEPHDFVKVTQNMKAGDLFVRDKLGKLTVQSDDGPGSLQSVAFPWKEVSVLYDIPCVRDLKANDIVFKRDAPSPLKEIPLEIGERALQIGLDDVKYEPALLIVGTQVGFVIDRDGPLTADPLAVGPNAKAALSATRPFIVEGPFRILSVGRRVSPQADSSASDVSASRVISIAVKTEKRDDFEVLEEKANRLMRAASPESGGRRAGIRAMVLYPFKR